MVEVFKTNVNDYRHAKRLVVIICESFPGYVANFDLEDCDRILRVKYHDGIVASGLIIELMRREGYFVEILCDEVVNTLH